MGKNDITIKTLIDLTQSNVRAMDKIASGIEKLNDSNILHKQAIDINSKATSAMVSETKALLSLMRWLTIALVASLIVLAGAEKVFKFIPLLSNELRIFG